MKLNTVRRSVVGAAAANITLALGLVACGGGGDSSPAPVVASTIDITALNSDSVGHASAAGIVALSPTLTIPLSASPAAALGRVAGLLRQWVRVASTAIGPPMARALAVQGPVVFACGVSGTMSLTVDDRDDSGDLGPGDVITTFYSGCRDTEAEMLDGTVTSTISQLASTSLSALLTMSQFSDTAARHALTLNGSMWVDDSQPGGTVEVTRLTAYGPVVASVTTHLFTDTVTLHDGFTEEATYDASFAPPPGGTLSGRSVSTVNGHFESAAAGGIVDILTLANAPLIKYNAEAYPRAGVVQVHGRNGTLQLTILSADSVQLDLDADDNGVAESSVLVSWDWLL